jgi:hypothetical protein
VSSAIKSKMTYADLRKIRSLGAHIRPQVGDLCCLGPSDDLDCSPDTEIEATFVLITAVHPGEGIYTQSRCKFDCIDETGRQRTRWAWFVSDVVVLRREP